MLLNVQTKQFPLILSLIVRGIIKDLHYLFISIDFCYAIEFYDKAISINPKFDSAWNNKGIDLHYLFISIDFCYAIECLDKAISINPKFDKAWNNKGFALVLQQNNVLLHKLQKYTDAISCYDQALSININPLRLQRKADSLKLLNKILKIFELGKKSEAKQFYLASLEKGSNDKIYIQKQLSKL